MAKAGSGHDGEFIQALTQCQRDLRAFILGMTPTKTDADDVLQEVNLALWKKRDLYDRNQSFLRWAFAFAVVQIRLFRNRAAKKQLWLNDAILDSVAEAFHHDSQIAEQRRDALRFCIRKLGPTEHRFINSFYGKQHSARELAESTGKPLSTVYKTLARARRALHECVERTLARQTRPV